MASAEIFDVYTVQQEDIKSGLINGETTIFINIFKDNKQELAQIKRNDLLQFASESLGSNIYNGLDYTGTEKSAMLDAQVGTEIKKYASDQATRASNKALESAKEYTNSQIQAAIFDVINAKY